MGTNFYLETKPPCQCCGRPFDQLHIGKSSAGWCFALHVIPEQGINDLDDWVRLWSQPEARITDECGNPIELAELLAIITERGREPPWDRVPFGYASWDAFHYTNHSVPGPQGLLRSRIDGRHCIGHGAGTWDLVVGEFS